MDGLFPPEPPDLAAQIREVKRELEQRRRVYPRMTQEGRLTKTRSERQMRDMEAVLATLEVLTHAAAIS